MGTRVWTILVRMAQLAVGDLLEDRYRIDHPIARGGMSMVWRCVDLRLGRAVAAKVLDEKYIADPVFRQRFRREARAMAQLNHPNLVNVYDFGSDGDHLYLIMELITGGTLRSCSPSAPAPHAAAAVLRSVLTDRRGAPGLVHRDIKPTTSNNGDHRVARRLRPVPRPPRRPPPRSSAPPLPLPEQSTAPISHPPPTFSAGIVLFELLTGTTPFSGDTPLDHAYRRLEDDVPAPSSASTASPARRRPRATATARDPQDRFADAAEFLAALDDVAGELELPSFTVPIPQNSAATRAAAVPTDITDLVGPPTMVTEITEAPPVTETRVHEPIQPPIEPPAQAPVPARIPEEPVEQPAPMNNRSKVGLVVWLLVIALLTAAIAIGAWWFGSGRYGEIPQVLGMDRTAAVTTVEDAGFRRDRDRLPRRGPSRPHRRHRACRRGEGVVRGNEVTVLVSQGRPTVPDPQGMDILSLPGGRRRAQFCR